MSRAGSLREYDNLADRLKAHRQADARGILMVEGPADRRLLARVSQGRWAIFICGTRSNVKKEMLQAHSLRLERVAGLIDRDFDDYYDSKCSSDSRLFTFETADLEAHLIDGPWFEDLVAEFCSDDKVTALGGVDHVRQLVTDPARRLGIYRRANACQGWGVDFVGLKFVRKVSAQSLVLDVDALIAAVRSRVPREHLPGFAEACGDARQPTVETLYRGKDALEVLAKGLSRALSSLRGVDGSSLEAALRLSADERLLASAPFRDISAALG